MINSQNKEAVSDVKNNHKCGEKCEIWSRVCGYYRPVSSWNKGKIEEFKERKLFKIVSFK